MVAMSEAAEGTGSEPEGGGVDFDALETDVMKGIGKLKLLKSSSGWTAIALPVMIMPGRQVDETLGAMFSPGGSGPGAITRSLDLLKLALLESTETDGGAKLDDLGFGEWIELLEQWANG